MVVATAIFLVILLLPNMQALEENKDNTELSRLWFISILLAVFKSHCNNKQMNQ